MQPSKIFGADERPDEIDQQTKRNGAAQSEIEHGVLDPVAERGIAGHQGDAASTDKDE